MAKVEPGMESMLEMYIFETNTLLEQLDEILLRTEDANVFSQEDINEIFRIMHTIKGSSAMMGFENLQHLAHKGEDMFFVIREKPEIAKDAHFVYELIFEVSDLYKAEIEYIQNSGDDDYTPTDFSETFKKLEDAIRKGAIDCIVVKDLSRFSRNYIDGGRYLEKIFPQLGIRFIAINDAYDSLTGDPQSDSFVIPFKNLINDSYCKDISMKIRSSLEVKQKSCLLYTSPSPRDA